MIIRTDTNGSEINRVTLGLSGQEFPWVIRPMFNGHYMVGAVSFKPNATTPFWSQTWLIELDSTGNKLNQWIDTSRKNLWARSIQQTADSGWIIVRQHVAYDVNDFQQYTGSILKLNKSFQKEWEILKGDTGGFTGFYDVEILPDGKYIVCGATPIAWSDSAYQWGWLLKIDTDGTVIWDRKYVAYPRFGAYSFLYDVDVLPNGDLLACGEMRLTENIGITPVQQGWILRTDSNGCVLDNCWLGIEEQVAETKNEIKTYPNPAHDNFSIEIESQQQQGGTLELYDINGRKILERKNNYTRQMNIDISNYSNGIYFWRYIKDNQPSQSGKIVKQ